MIQIASTDPVDLVVAWRAGATSQGRTVRISPGIAAQLRGIAVAVAAGLISGQPYSPDADLEDNSHLVAGREQLLDTQLLATLESGPDLAEASENDLTSRPLLCYALVVGEAPSRRIFIRKRSPVSLMTKSVVAQLLSGTLDRIESPLLAFDAAIDVIVDGDIVYVLNKSLFEGLFKESEAVLREIPKWVDRFTSGFPVTPGSRDVLIEHLRRNSFLRTKIHAALARPYIGSLTSAQIEEKLIRHGFDASVYMRDGEVDFTQATTRDIVRLLNEDLFVGDFSEEHFAASSKRRL